MSNLLVFWLSLGVFALMVEMFTGTLYGLSVSLSAFLLAAYVYTTGETVVSFAQAALLAVASAAFCYGFPKLFRSRGTAFRSAIERQVGQTFALKKAGAGYSIAIDGVDYLVPHECVTEAFAPGKKVVLDGYVDGRLGVTLPA